MRARLCEYCDRRIEAFELRCVCREQIHEEATTPPPIGRMPARPRCDYCRANIPRYRTGPHICATCATAFAAMNNRLKCQRAYRKRTSEAKKKDAARGQ